MTAESASTAISGTRRGIKILSVTLVVAAGCIAVWYRGTFHAWPGQQGSRVHWCGRDYEDASVRAEDKATGRHPGAGGDQD